MIEIDKFIFINENHPDHDELNRLYPMKDDDHTFCSSSKKSPLLCTRSDNHTGPHVGHGARNNIIGVWPNENKL